MLVQGKITNKQTSETIPGAQVFISDASGTMLNPPRGAASDVNGMYALNVNTGDYITATFVGLQRKTAKVGGSIINFDLDISSGASLAEVEVSEKKPFNWKLTVGLILLLAGVTYFTIDILKYKKVIFSK